MATVVVAGFTQADIEAAVAAADDGGTVLFPDGTYPVADLVATVPNQTWELGRGATVQRTGGGHMLTVNVPGLRLRGGTWDGGRTAGGTASGIIGGGGADIEGVTIQAVDAWGVYFAGGPPLRMRHVTIRDTGAAGILWQAAVSCQGPVIEHVTVDRLTGYGSSGGILVQSTVDGQYVKSPRILDCDVTLPAGSTYDAVCIEVLRAAAPLVQGCSTSYGRIGISFGKCRNARVIGNQAAAAYSYNFEVAAASLWSALIGNAAYSASGPGPTHGHGVRVTGASNNTKVVGNSVYWNAAGQVTVDANCLNCIVNDNN